MHPPQPKKCQQSARFRAAYRDLLDAFKKKKSVMELLVFAGLLGSAADGEAIEGYSDLDVLLILDADEEGGIDFRVISELHTLAEETQGRFPTIRIALLTHTWNDFSHYVNFEYLQHYSRAEVGFERTENEFKSRLKRASSKAGVKEPDVVNRYCLNQLRMLRFNVTRKCASPANKKALAKYLIDTLIKVLDLANIAEGRWANSKFSLIEQTDNLYPRVDMRAARIAYSLRTNWATSDVNDYERIITEVPKLIVSLVGEVIRNHPDEAHLK